MVLLEEIPSSQAKVNSWREHETTISTQLKIAMMAAMADRIIRCWRQSILSQSMVRLLCWNRHVVPEIYLQDYQHNEAKSDFNHPCPAEHGKRYIIKRVVSHSYGLLRYCRASWR